ncbi:hypothetical protein BJV74DRAFT_834306 [Russula compacta]|nr:hypothetical protein BJV74DRAFT_834306 [Russula compacta]
MRVPCAVTSLRQFDVTTRIRGACNQDRALVSCILEVVGHIPRPHRHGGIVSPVGWFAARDAGRPPAVRVMSVHLPAMRQSPVNRSHSVVSCVLIVRKGIISL